MRVGRSTVRGQQQTPGEGVLQEPLQVTFYSPFHIPLCMVRSRNLTLRVIYYPALEEGWQLFSVSSLSL